MHCTINEFSASAVHAGSLLLLSSQHQPGIDPGHIFSPELPDSIPVGAIMSPPGREAWFQVHGHCWMPGHPGTDGLWVRAKRDVSATELPRRLQIVKSGVSLAWVTLSDSGAAGKRNDSSGPRIPEMISKHLPLCLSRGFILRDDAGSLQSLLTHLALCEGFDLIVTTGGTGVAPRDITPEVTAGLVHKRLPGFEQAMMQASLAATPRAAISRAVAGILGSSLIINLPGSPKGVRENLAPLLPALDHTLDKIHGDPADCGRETDGPTL
ncbi:MogA/MoaB family molybdenum cofactor biosynthesis protein [Desulfovermiculus halophilus]|jgi:molybdenum cofactor synthesis domain-containing protein|uniref:MogA/MoaB family molybdenum cofactor biosynthesis protein n=1 Tax=Desulfovermiculus halophilus TaxID=339722 RepID=UPI00068645AC|nr:MogA/MoaB family molybdenum cofactor biosynthesis protein [Desulfovermiculus halophilus]